MNRSSPLLALALLAAALLADPQAAQSEQAPALVSLNRHIVVHDDIVHLGDIFSGLDEQADRAVGRAPTPGTSVRLDARWLAALARTYDIPWQPQSRLDTADVERASYQLEREELTALLEDALAARGEYAPVELRFEQPAGPLILPLVEGAEAEIIGLSQDPRGSRFSATLVYPNRGTPLARVEISGRIYSLVEVPVPSRRLSRDGVIATADILWEQVRADRLPEDAVMDMADVLGKTPRRSLRPGDPIRMSELADPIIVQRNSKVTLRLNTQALRLSTAGRAMEDGAAGATIRVMNTSSNTIVTGVVARDGSVEVSAASARAIN